MDPNFSQTKRSFRVTLPSSIPNTAFITSMQGEERLGRPFEYRLSLIISGQPVDYNNLLGQPVTVELDLDKTTIRYWNGLVSQLELVQYSGTDSEYRITLVPWISMLKQAIDCKIYQNMTVQNAIKGVFSTFGFTDFTDKTTENPGTEEYIVQYRESAFDFVSRLMEQEGIYYFFTHANRKHTLVMCDGPSGHQAYPGYSLLEYWPGENAPEECLKGWGQRQEIKSGKLTLNDFNFETPAASLKTTQVAGTTYANGGMEVYDYPGLFKDATNSGRYSKVRMLEIKAGQNIYEGTGTTRGMSCGSTFTLDNDPHKLVSEFLTTSLKFDITSDDYVASIKGKSGTVKEEGKPVFTGSIQAIDSAWTFRPPRFTPRPILAGPQTAIVTGPGGQEIYTDSFGRIKVQFNWDQVGTNDENTTCFIRVAQSLAGVGWGSWFVPRIGMEVVVSFLEGNPDRPLVTGCVYNAVNKQARTLPDTNNISYLRTNSTIKGDQQYNEMGWDDTKGSENHFTTAQKDENKVVNNNRYDGIGQDSHLTINNDQYTAVGEDHHDYVKRNRMTKVDGDVHNTVGGKCANSITGQLSLSVTGDVVEVFSGNHSEVVTKNYYVKAANVTLEGTENITLMVGDQYIAINSSGIKICTTGTVVIEGTGAVSMTSDGDQVTVSGAAGVTVESSSGNLTGTGTNISMTANAEMTIKGSASGTFDGGGMATIKGGTVAIN